MSLHSDLHRAHCAQGLGCETPQPSLSPGHKVKPKPQGHRLFENHHGSLECLATERDSSHSTAITCPRVCSSTKCSHVHSVCAPRPGKGTAGSPPARPPVHGSCPRPHGRRQSAAQSRLSEARFPSLCPMFAARASSYFRVNLLFEDSL